MSLRSRSVVLVALLAARSAMAADSGGAIRISESGPMLAPPPASPSSVGELSAAEAERLLAPVAPSPFVPAADRVRFGAPVEIAWPGGLSGSAIAMLTADLDLDGRADLVTAFATEAGGAIAVARGTGSGLRSSGPWFEAMSLPITLPFRPDFLVTGDFDADGHADLIVAQRGGDTFGFLAGGGSGSPAPVRILPAGGSVTALASGELFRSDGRTDLVLAVSASTGVELRTFRGAEGGIGSDPIRTPLTAPATALLAAIADPEVGTELFVGSGGRLLRARGADLAIGSGDLRNRFAAAQRLPESPVSIAVGRFGADPARREVAAFLGDGRIVRFGAGRAGGLEPIDLGDAARFAPRQPARLALAAAQVASGAGEQILSLDPASGFAGIRFPPRDGRAGEVVPLDVIATVLLPFAPAGGGRSGVLAAGAGRTVFLPTAVNNVFTVDTTADTNDTFPADGVCLDAAGKCSLRAAIQEANALGGPDAVEFALGTGTPTITLATSGLPNVLDTLEIRGGTGGATRIEINGNNLPVFMLPVLGGSDGSLLESLVLNRTTTCGSTNCGIGIYMSSGNNVIRNCYVGTDAAGGGSVPTHKGDLVWLVGSGATGNRIGGSVAADRNVLSNSAIQAIRLENAPLNTISGNFIGIAATGNALLKNISSGITFRSGASGNRVGDSTSAPGVPPGNVIAGCDEGVEIRAGANNVTISGNAIGTNAAGTAGLGGNGNSAVEIVGGANVMVGGATVPYRNLLSGNDRGGVMVSGTNTGGAYVYGNFIGTDITGMTAVPNGIPWDEAGVWLTGSSGTVSNVEIGAATSAPGTPPGNVISGNGGTNGGSGILMSVTAVTGNRIAGNLIGLNVAGAALPNRGNGIQLNSATNTTIGGSAANLRNVISGNRVVGVQIDSYASGAGSGYGNVVAGNYIGTNVAGTAAIPNLANGVVFIAGSVNSTIGGATATPGTPPGNVISGNGQAGVYLYDVSGHTIRGNLIGTNAAGTAAMPNSQIGVYLIQLAANIVIGGTGAGEGNVISGNGSYGIFVLRSLATTIQGNTVGLDRSGATAVPNTGGGIYMGSSSAAPYNVSGALVGGTGTGRNVISGNGGHGVVIAGSQATSCSVKGNWIGVAADGVTLRPNTGRGVQIEQSAKDNTIGGTTGLTSGACSGDCNVIAGNGGIGVNVESAAATGNRLLGNSIHSNGGIGLALNLGAALANDLLDPDSGPNNWQNFPVITGVVFDGVTSTVSGTLNTNAGGTGLSIDVSTSSVPYGANRGARFWAGRSTGLSADGSGNVTFSIPIAGPLGYLTATATDTAGNTSELSPVFIADGDGDAVPDVADCAPGNPTSWSLPSATGTLFVVSDPTSKFTWSAPANPGGSSVLYDLVRSDSPSDFSAAIYVGSNLAVTTKTDGGEVSPSCFYYLVRAKNACGNGP